MEVCCGALARLAESGICHGSRVLDALVPPSEGRPADLELQRRASVALQDLVSAGAVNAEEARQRAAFLLSPQWAHLLSRFLGAEEAEARLHDGFHAEVQALFHEEVARHFEYEAAERSLHLLRARGAGGPRLFREVLRCLVENLEDYRKTNKSNKKQ